MKVNYNFKPEDLRLEIYGDNYILHKGNTYLVTLNKDQFTSLFSADESVDFDNGRGEIDLKKVNSYFNKEDFGVQKYAMTAEDFEHKREHFNKFGAMIKN